MPNGPTQSVNLMYEQSSFRGGINQAVDPTKIADNEYMLLLNGRVRYDVPEPVNMPVLRMNGLPNGNFQGIYAAGGYLLAFVDGIAYYSNAALANSNFVAVPQWTPMSAIASVIYAEAVPASAQNFTRKTVDITKIQDGVNLSDVITGSPRCVVCQDGINTPNIIDATPVCRVAQTYAQWTRDNPEYVPVGGAMAYVGDTLYILFADGTGIYRSVGGMPLNFVVSVDADGEKSGDANITAHYVGFNSIKGINKTNSSDGTFIASSPNGTSLVTPVPDQIFGEPLYANTGLFPTGVLNQFSFVDINGDAALIDVEGIKSFNAVLTLKNTGKNAPFSAQISNLLAGVTQSNTTCAIEFDDYAFFSINTIYGHGIMVYDTQYQKYVSFDFPTLGNADERIKQFAAINLDGVHKLFGLSTDNKLYELYAHTTEVEDIGIYLGEWTSSDPAVEQRAYNFRAVFNEIQQTGTIIAQLYSDRVLSGEIKSNIINPIVTVTPPIEPPFGNNPQIDSVRVLSFLFNDVAESAWKIGVWLTWDFKCKLSHVSLVSTPIVAQMSQEQAAQESVSVTEGSPVITSITPLTGPVGTIVTIGGRNLTNVIAASLGSVAANSITFSESTFIVS